MKVIEQYINSKTGELSDCEDGILVAKNFICVVDGATSKGKMLWGGKKGGFFAKELVLEVVQQFDEDIDAVSAIKALNNVLAKQYEGNFQHFVENPQDRIGASVIIYSRRKKQVWSYGDCQFINEKLFFKEKKIDRLVSEVRALYNTLLLEGGMSVEQLKENDLGRNLISPILCKQSLFANKDIEFGYPVLNGISINEKLIKIYPVERGKELIFASDGYPFLKKTLKESEQVLKSVLQSDPLFIGEYKSTKGLSNGNISYDDRCYIRFIT